MARSRHRLPETFTKFRAGLLSADQVLLLCRHCPPDHETSVVEFAINATLPQLSRTLKNYAWPQPTPTNPSDDDKKQATLNQYWALLEDARSEGDNEPVTNHEAFMALIDSAANADPSTNRRNRHRALLHIEDPRHLRRH